MKIIAHISFNPTTKEIVNHNDADKMELYATKGGVAVRRRT